MDNDNRIGQLIKKYRNERGMTQLQLSEASGINFSLIRNYEVGNRKPKLEQLKILADALDVSINDFLDIEIESTNDVMSLIQTLKNQTALNLTGEKDENGNYIPSSICLKFNDKNINRILAYYMKAIEMNNPDKPVTFMLKQDGIEMPTDIEKSKKN